MISLRAKRLLLIGLFVASVVAIATALYFMFFRTLFFSPTTSTTPDGETPSYTTLPPSDTGAPSPVVTPSTDDGRLTEADEVARGGVTETFVLTDSSISSATLSSSGDEMNFYNPGDGRFYTIDEDGNLVQLSSATFPEAETVEWNANAEKAVIEFPDGSNIVYDFVSEQQVTLPSHWEDFAFSPVSDEIAAKSTAVDPNNNWVVISSDDGSQVEAIQALGENADKVEINWSPNDQVVAFSNTSQQLTSGFDRKTILPLGKNQENFKGLVVEGNNFSSLWSPSGKQLLYSVSGDYSDYKPLLWIVDATSSTMGENRQSLGVNTWVEKCTFASSSLVYCAVPQELESGAGLQPSLYRRMPDSVYSIDVNSGNASLVAVPATDTTMSNLSVSTDGSILYYTNTLSERLEKINLK